MARRRLEPQVAGATFELGDQRGLADARVAADQGDLRLTLRGEREGVVQLGALGVAADQSHAVVSAHHVLPRTILAPHPASLPGRRPRRMGRNAETGGVVRPVPRRGAT